MDPKLFLEALKGHTWPIVAAFLVGLIVRYLKSPAFPLDIPVRYRPLLAVALGVLSGASEAVIAGTPLVDALVGGLFSAGAAIVGHDVLIEGARGGREIGLPPPPAGTALFIVAIVLGVISMLTGCAGDQKIAEFAGRAVDVSDVAVGCEASRYEAEQRACLDLPEAKIDGCIALVRQREKTIEETFDAFHDAVCALAPSASGCP